MSLRRKTLLISSVTILCLIGVLQVVAQIILMNSFAQLETQETRENTSRVQNALAIQAAQLEQTARDWAFWDDTYAFVENGNADYIRANLNRAAFNNLGLNLAVFVNASGKIVYSRAFDLATQKETPASASILEQLTPDNPLFRRPNLQSSVTGILLFPTGSLLIVALPILTSHGEGPARGTLIFGRYLDASAIAGLSKTTDLDLAFYRLDTPNLPVDVQAAYAALSNGTATAVRPLDAQTIAGYALLPDVYGKPALILRVNTARDIYEQGQASILYWMWSLVAIGSIFFAIVWLVLDQLFVKRIFDLSDRIKQIASAGEATARVQVTGNDELTQLAAVINHMLDAIAQAQHALAHSEEKFAQVFRASPMLMAISDLEKGLYLDVNDAFLQTLGYTRAEVIGHTSHELNLFAQPEQRRHALQLLEDQGYLREFEALVQNQAGQILEGLFSAEYIELQDRRVLLTVMNDMTERKHAEKAQNASEQRYRQLFEGMANGAALHELVCDANGKPVDYITLEVNREYEQLLGVPRELVLGNRAYATTPNLDRAWLDMFSQVALTGQPRHYVQYASNLDKWFEGTAFSPTAQQFCVTFIDITERKRVEQEKERLLQQVMSARQQLADLSHRLVEIEGVERKRLARELHDRVGQNLTVLGINLNIMRAQIPAQSKVLEKIDDSLKLVQETMNHVRDVMAELRPAVLDDYGLVAALRWYTEQFSRRTNIAVTVDSPEPSRRLKLATETALFRIAQEALNNVAKHAQASHVNLDLGFFDETARLTITDNGVGFDAAMRSETGWGLVTMQERAEAVGGTWRIVSAPGQGTQVSIEVSARI